MWILILMCSTAFIGIMFLLFFRIWIFRNLNKGELHRGIISSRPFLEGSGLDKIKVKYNLNVAKYVSSLGLGKHLKGTKKHMKRFEDYINGKHSIKSNGYNKYWDKVNGEKEKLE
ncbi:hypothetical protein ACFLZC_00755 [Patescibacteria group bacterium]